MANKNINGVIYGNQNIFVPSHLNFGAYILQKILSHDRNKTALINGTSGEKITYKEMAQRIVGIATSLTSIGIKNGDLIAIFSENRFEYLLTMLAVSCLGGTVTFWNSAYTKDDLVHAINIAKPSYIFLSGETFNKHYENLFKISRTSIKYIIYDDVATSNNECLSFKKLDRKDIDVNSFKPYDFKGSTSTGIILYSSGTTGLAKGAKISHRNLLVACQKSMITQKNLTLLTVAPWSSTMGLMCIFYEIVNGKSQVFLTKYNEMLYLSTIEKYKVGYIVVVPALIVMLYKSSTTNKYDLSTVEVVYTGGAPLDPQSIRDFKSKFPHVQLVLQGYGMTEATGAVTEDTEVAPKEGSVGKVVQGCIVKIVDPDSDKILPWGKPGEVCIKGPVLFEGYLGKDSTFDKDGFYRTGDVAYYDEDGYFYIIDRIKELIKYKGWQVSPSELEAVILQHPAVGEVGVTGAPDVFAGELPTAFVVKKPNANVTEQEIIDFVSNKVSPWKRLTGGVIFLKELPKTSSGKIVKRELKAHLKQRAPKHKL